MPLTRFDLNVQVQLTDITERHDIPPHVKQISQNRHKPKQQRQEHDTALDSIGHTQGKLTKEQERWRQAAANRKALSLEVSQA